MKIGDRRPSKDAVFMAHALVAAQRSSCLRRAVGCVLINSLGHIVATGYNGVPRGAKHCNHAGALKRVTHEPPFYETKTIYPHACAGARSPSGQDLDRCRAIHAEQNALLQCPNVMDVFTAYVTVFPCVTCTKLLLNTSCQRIVTLGNYAGGADEMWKADGRQIMYLKRDKVPFPHADH